MNPPSGLSDLAATNARFRRRRSNPNPQPEDRQAILSSHHQTLHESSIPSKRSVPIQYDPDLTTPAWEVYRDPSDEFIPGDRGQPSVGDASANTPAPAPHQEGTQGPLRPSIPPFRSRHTIVYAPDEASRIVTERMLRTLDQIQAEEQERKAMAFFAGHDIVNTSVTGATDEVIGRLEKRYAELALQEEGTSREDAEEDHHRGSAFNGEGERRGHKKKKKKNKKGKKQKEKIEMETEMETESVEGSIYDQGTNAELWLDATVSEPPISTSDEMPIPSAPTVAVTGPSSGPVGASFADRNRARKRAKMTKRAEGDLRSVAQEHAQPSRGITPETMADVRRGEIRVDSYDAGS